jgi:hypothetical protein
MQSQSQCASSKGVQALVVGAFAEHSADVHALVDGLAEAATPRTSHHYLVGPSKATGAAKALLYAAFGAAAWNAQSALLQSRPSFAGAPAKGPPIKTKSVTPWCVGGSEAKKGLGSDLFF